MLPPSQAVPDDPVSEHTEDSNELGPQETTRLGEASPSFALNALFRLNPQMMWVYDRKTLRFIDVNEAAIARYGYSREEFLARGIPDIAAAGEIPRFRRKITQLSESAILSEEWRHRTRDGQLFHVEEHSSALVLDGKPVALSVIQDITARKEAEAERDRMLSEQPFTMDSARSFFWQAELEDDAASGRMLWHMILDAPDDSVSLFPIAIGPSENFSIAWPKCRIEEDRAITDAYANQQIRNGRGFVREFRFRTRDDEVRWASEEVSIEVIEPGRLWRAVGVVSDVTERKRAEATLRYMMDSAHCLLWYADVTLVEEDGTLDWRLTVPTEATAAQRILPLEVPPGTSYTVAWERSRHPDDYEEMDQRAREHILRNQGYSQEFRCFDKYQKVHWLKEDVHVEPVGPGHWRAVGVCTDITGTKEAEAGRKSALDALAASEERYRTVVESVRDVIYQTDADGRCIFLNEAWEKITGYTVAESMGYPLTEIITDEHQEQYTTLWTTLKSGGSLPDTCEIACLSASGQTLWLEISAQSTCDGMGHFSGALGTIRDITERRQLQDQLIRTEKLVALGVMAAGVAHEINNPLTVASTLAQFLEANANPEVQRDANTIRRMTDRIERIVHSLRVFAYDESRESRRPIRIETLLDETMNIVGGALYQAEIQVEQDIEDDLPELAVNRGEIEQVLVNLLMNAEHALRSIPPEARRVRISAYRDTAETSGKKETVCIAVQDNGTGIPQEIKRRIFDPFFTTKVIGEGTGLGLSICHGIVQSHGGTLTVESEVGKGSTFVLTLPVK